MSFWEKYRLQICKNPKMAGHAYCAPLNSSAKKNLEMLKDELGQLENSLYYLEYVPDFRDYAHKIEEVRGKIGTIKEAISKPLAYVSLYEDSKQLLSDLREIRRFDPNTNRIGAAKAYGKAMQSLGKLVGKLPGIGGAFGTLIAEMGKIFHEVVANMQPEIHMGEPGLKEEILEKSYPGF